MADAIVYSAAAPAGHTPSFSYPFSANGLIIVNAIFIPLAILFTGIRTYTRVSIVGALASDDYVMLAALATSIALTGTILDLLNYGLGKHLYDVPLDVLYPSFLKINVVAAVLFCAATGMAKTSILLFYKRIFPSRTFNWVVWGLIVFTAGYSTASVFVNIFSCAPVAASWELKYAATAVCINRPVFYFAQAGMGIVTDFATVLAPIPMMWKLQMPFRQKIGVAGLLTTGGFVCIVSIIRLQSLYVLLKSSDLTMVTVNALMWCVIELNMSIAGGCVPTLRPFLRKHFPGILGTTQANYGTGTSRRAGTRDRHQSHPLSSFEPSTLTSKNQSNFGWTTISGTDGLTRRENESEEYIVQQHPKEDENTIVKTVEFGYDDMEAGGHTREPKN